MKVGKKPCKECPFKKDSFKGYLGGFTVEETLEAARSEHSFICHLDRELNVPNHLQFECIGRLQFANKTCKSFKNPDLEELRISVKPYGQDNILGFDFAEHHKDSY